MAAHQGQRKSFRQRAARLTTAVVLLLMSGVGGLAEEPIRIQETFPAGYQYRVSSRVEITGSLSLPAEGTQAVPKSLPVTGTSAIDYDERILDIAADGLVQKTLRVFRRIDFQHIEPGGSNRPHGIRKTDQRQVLLRCPHLDIFRAQRLERGQ